MLGVVAPVKANISNQLVISEVQVGGVSASDEFVEIYNPTGEEVDLSRWRLRLGNGNNLVASMSGTIKPFGFFLVVNPAYTSITVPPDMVYSAASSSITANSSIHLLRSDPAGFVAVDLLGMGTAGEFETLGIAAPLANQSLERKSGNSGILETEGNGWDTNDNSVDFVTRPVPQPQNTSSQAETPIILTPSPDPTNVPTIAPTNVPIPTVISTATPTTQPLPTTIPTLTANPTPTAIWRHDNDHFRCEKNNSQQEKRGSNRVKWRFWKRSFWKR